MCVCDVQLIKFKQRSQVSSTRTCAVKSLSRSSRWVEFSKWDTAVDHRTCLTVVWRRRFKILYLPLFHPQFSSTVLPNQEKVNFFLEESRHEGEFSWSAAVSNCSLSSSLLINVIFQVLFKSWSLLSSIPRLVLALNFLPPVELYTPLDKLFKALGPMLALKQVDYGGIAPYWPVTTRFKWAVAV